MPEGSENGTMKFGALIRARRKVLHMQQKELADQLGVTPSAICKWESDSTYPDITLLLPLARALGITVDEMLSYDEVRPDAVIAARNRQRLWDEAASGTGALGQVLQNPEGGIALSPSNERNLQDVPSAASAVPVPCRRQVPSAFRNLPQGTAGEAETAQGEENIATPANSHIFIGTFGFFDIYVDGQAILFTHAKSKELLALFVDRRGGYLTAREAITYLWENEPVSKTTLSRCRKVAMRMNETLRKYGIEDIVKAQRGVRCLDISKVHCDLYDYLSGRSPRLYRGTYMLNYSWAEYTIAELDRERRYRQ